MWVLMGWSGYGGWWCVVWIGGSGLRWAACSWVMLERYCITALNKFSVLFTKDITGA